VRAALARGLGIPILAFHFVLSSHIRAHCHDFMAKATFKKRSLKPS